MGLCLLGGEAGELLELLLLLVDHLLEVTLLHLQELLLVLDAVLLLFYLTLTASELFLTLVQRDLTLFQAVLALLDLLVTLLDLFLELGFLVDELLLHFQELALFHGLSILVGLSHALIIFSFEDIPENRVAYDASDNEGDDGDNYCYH